MNELFEIPPPRVMYEKCDCKLVMRNKKQALAPSAAQPVVTLQQSLDSRYFVGSCPRCKKIVTKEI